MIDWLIRWKWMLHEKGVIMSCVREKREEKKRRDSDRAGWIIFAPLIRKLIITAINSQSPLCEERKIIRIHITHPDEVAHSSMTHGADITLPSGVSRARKMEERYSATGRCPICRKAIRMDSPCFFELVDGQRGRRWQIIPRHRPYKSPEQLASLRSCSKTWNCVADSMHFGVIIYWGLAQLCCGRALSRIRADVLITWKFTLYHPTKRMRR